MNIKILTILALVISTIYIYYTVQKDKDGLYETLSIASDKISEHIVEEPIKKIIVETTPIVEPPKEVVEQIKTEEATIETIVKITSIVENSTEVLEQKEIDEPIKENIVEEKVSIAKEEVYVKKDINNEESLESAIAAALKGINTSKIIKTEENE